jgi:DNA-binding phage protein
MALTRDFKMTVLERAQRDPKFRRGLLEDGIALLLAGELDTGKAILRDYINATIGFEKLGRLTKHTPKSLMRMFSKDGNPRAENLFGVIKQLQKKEGVAFELKTIQM